MKKLYVFIWFVLAGLYTYAQAPYAFKYQAVARNVGGNVLQNQNVSFRISLLQGSSTGAAVYSEEHAATTNAFGLVNLEIGNGSNVTGIIDSIHWANGPYFIKIEMDATGGNTFSEMGVTQLLSVPYALYAASGNQGPQGPQGSAGSDGINGQDGVGITSTLVQNDSLYITLSNGTTLNAGYVVGPQGLQGTQGDQGIQGLPGADGVSVTNSYILNDSLYILLSNNQTINAGYVRGLQGEQGIQGVAGQDGANGINGISISWLGNLAAAPASPALNNVYYNTTDKKAYIFNGSSWDILAQDGVDGNTGPMGPQGAAGTGLTNRGAWVTGTDYNPSDYVFDRSTGDSLVNSMWICQAAATFNSIFQPYLDNTNWVEFQAPAGQNGVSLTWLGTFATAPSSPQLNYAYYNSADKKSYVWNGVAWEVISLDGVDGVTGLQGIQGEPGLQGIQGNAGQDGIGITSSYIANDSLFLVYSNSTIVNAGHVRGAQGPLGIQGDQGIQGEQGIPGIQGNTGDNGIGITNTYVSNDSLFIIFSSGSAINAGHVRGQQGPQGIAGANGTNGADGTNGTNGINGTDGKTILSGTIYPTSEGLDGDFYINTTTNQIFGPKTEGAWGAGTSLIGPQGTQGSQGIQGEQGLQGIQGTPGTNGVDGTNGTNGYSVLSGASDPTAGTGVDGDFYINTTSNTIFGPKTGGTWGTGTSLVGPAGTYTPGTGISIASNTISLSSPVSIANGGTNASSYTANQFLLYNGTAFTASGYSNTSFANATHSHTTLTRGSGLTGSNYDGSTATTWAIDFGTGATQVATGNHTHTQLHNQSHAITSTSDHTAGNWKLFYSNGSGQVTELSFGTSGQVLSSTGASSTPSWTTPTLGTVTSVGLSMPSVFSVSGSPVTSSGTLTASFNSQTANYVFAAPNGSAGTPTFRALVAADLPSHSHSSLTPGTGLTGTAYSGSAAVSDWAVSFAGSGSVNSAAHSDHTHTSMVTGSGTATQVAFWSNASALTSSSNLYWDNTNFRLGIGTSSPTATLSVQGNSIFNFGRSGGANHVTIRGYHTGINYGVLAFQAYNDATDINIAEIAGLITGHTSGSESGGLLFSTKPASGATSERMRINENGNVGIGTTTPNTGLHIAKNATWGAPVWIDATGVTGGRLWVIQSTGGDHSAGQGKFIFRDEIASINVMTLLSSGNVGIGTTNPSATLTVNGSMLLTGATRSISKDANQRLDIFNVGGLNSTGPFWIGYHFSPPDALTLAGSNVYPRTSIYWNYNTVANPTDATFNYYLGNTGGLTASLAFGTESAGNIDFLTAGTNRVRITGTGNVGIGTTNPTTTLHLEGSFRYSDDSEAPGKVLTSIDANGNATWASPAIGSASGTANYVAKFTSATALGNSQIFDNGTNVGIGATNPFHGKLAVVSTNGAAAGPNAQINAIAGSTAQGQRAVISFWPTFEGTGDNGARRAADIVAGFSGGAWCNQYLAFHTGDCGANDAANLTYERMRINGNGYVGIGTANPTGKVQIAAGSSLPANVPIFEIKDQNNHDVMVVYKDSIHFYVQDPFGGAKGQNRGCFAVSGKSDTKAVTSNYFYLNPANNFIGQDAGKSLSGALNYSGKYNTFIGYQAGYTDTSGYKNYFIGYKSGYTNKSGYSNIFIGDSVGFSNTSGHSNVFMGNKSGSSNTIGWRNVFMGYQSGISNINGMNNVFIGTEAGYSNTYGLSNTFIGNMAGHNHQDGQQNVYIGQNAAYSDVSGLKNVIIGSSAATSKASGDNNVVLGYRAGNNLNGSGNVFIGYYAGYNETGSNKLYIANTSTDPPLIYGDFSNGRIGLGTTSPDLKLRIWTNDGDGIGITGGGANTLMLFEDNGFARVKYDGNNLRIGTNADNNLLTLNSTYVGIGTTSASFPLDVATSANSTQSYGWLNSAGNIGTSSGTNAYSIRAAARILATEFNANSDARIKNITGYSDTKNDLDLINKIKVTNYTYIDKVNNGNQIKEGFIAQQVEQIIPEAVKYSSNFIPDIYELTTVISFEKEKQILTVGLSKPHQLAVNDTVRIYLENAVKEAVVSEVISDKKFVLKNWNSDTEKIFVYGKKVSDFRAVDYDRIFTTGIGAIQELSKEVELLKVKNTSLEKENTLFKAEIEKINSILGTSAKK
ncbi:MAG: tail fiber domain-containing protein [Bacteroidia bacterium]|nr:tail fiber domain-containing protein [Bacteroidia bacterium]